MRTSIDEFMPLIEGIHAAADMPERWVEAYASITRWINHVEPALRSESAVTRHSDSGSAALRSPSSDAHPASMLLSAYFEIAKRIQENLAEAVAGRLAVAGLNRWSAGAFIVDGEATVYHQNTSTQAIISDVSVVNSKLRFRKPGFSKVFDAALLKATQDSPRTTVLPFSCAGEGICELTVSPLEEVKVIDSPIRLALVVIARRAADAEAIAQRGRQLYGLTYAEARVMSAITLGATVDEIAALHNVRPSTVRAQVRSIFDKTGVNRQSDLVRLALSAAQLLSSRKPCSESANIPVRR